LRPLAGKPSGFHGLEVNRATVSIQQSVEWTIAHSGRQNTPQADNEEHDFDVNRGKEIENNHA
jgi:hypothetical protein